MYQYNTIISTLYIIYWPDGGGWAGSAVRAVGRCTAWR